MEPRLAPAQRIWRRTSHRGIVIALMTLIVSLAIVPAPKPAHGGGGQAGLHLFKGVGGDLSIATRKPGPPPLTAFDLKTLAGMVGSEPGSLFAKLTPREPSIGYKAALVFVDPKLVETGASYASWGSSQTRSTLVGPYGSLILWLKPVAARRYLIDCAVAGTTPQPQFEVAGPSGTAPMQVDATPGGQHLTFVLDATDNKWLSFRIDGNLKPSTTALRSNLLAPPVEWTFYSCEITNL